jgi:hypothetical protein
MTMEGGTGAGLTASSTGPAGLGSPGGLTATSRATLEKAGG